MNKALVGLLIGLVFVLLLALVGCGGGGQSAPTPTAYATRTPLPTFTATPNVPPTPIPSPRPVGPTPTAPRPADINPLTGLKVDPAKLQRRPLGIKVENSAESRPQTGLLQADLVYEYRVEYGITRFLALYVAEEPEKVGPVRSARPMDLELAPQYDAVLVDSGASIQVDEMLAQATDIVRISDAKYGEPYFYRVKRTGYAYEHTLYTSVPELRKLLQSLNAEKPVPLRGFQFDEKPPQGKPATRIHVPFSDNTAMDYSYDPQTKLYKRQMGGKDFIDEASGQAVAHRNVLVQFVKGTESILVDSTVGKVYLYAYEMTGEGKATLFRDGVMVEGKWQRQDRHEMTRFQDGTGNELKLAPGHTWILVVLEDTPVTAE